MLAVNLVGSTSLKTCYGKTADHCHRATKLEQPTGHKNQKHEGGVRSPRAILRYPVSFVASEFEIVRQSSAAHAVVKLQQCGSRASRRPTSQRLVKVRRRDRILGTLGSQTVVTREFPHQRRRCRSAKVQTSDVAQRRLHRRRATKLQRASVGSISAACYSDEGLAYNHFRNQVIFCELSYHTVLQLQTAAPFKS